ncbi:hypothetical protein [Streptomyces oceani]|uniref:hypothetical protein n=1 Tax=Streptomyces oceani TaxID=1075402 RepID=UPI001112E29E|nr:hypothetical protein [Streptomyces oceani]
MIDPSGVPDFTGSLEQLAKDVKGLRGDAGDIRDTGADTHANFQGLSAFYTAPEAEQLFATTEPVKTRADTFASDLETVADALDSYASEVEPIIAKLKRLKADAKDFVASVEDDDEWKYDEDKVDRNNELLTSISTAVAEFWAAERTAANKITKLFGGTHWVAGDGSGAKNMYGFSAEDMKKAGKTPWGKAVKEKHHWYEVGHWAKSFVWDGIIVDGIWGTLKGLGGLVGLQGWETFTQSWKGLGQLATGLVVISNPVNMLGYSLMPDGAVKNWIDDSVNTTKEVGKSLVAWDQWGKNPARAAGLTVFNVVTTVATAGTGAVAKTGTAGKVVAAAGKAGKAIDPMTYIGKAASAGLGKLPKISDVTASLKNLSTIEAVELPNGGVRLPDGQPVPPGSALPELPAGTNAVELPDGSVQLPDGSTLRPDGSLESPTGAPVQAGDEAPVEAPATERAGGSKPDEALPGRAVPEQELVGAGARTNPGEVTAQVGDDLPAGGHTPDLPGGSVTDNTPTGPTAQAGDNPPTGGTGGRGGNSPSGPGNGGYTPVNGPDVGGGAGPGGGGGPDSGGAPEPGGGRGGGPGAEGGGYEPSGEGGVGDDATPSPAPEGPSGPVSEGGSEAGRGANPPGEGSGSGRKSWPASEEVQGPARGKELREPHPRHTFGGIKHGEVKPENSLILPEVRQSVRTDIEQIAKGEAHFNPVTQRYEINGRVYGVESSGTVFPDSGQGIVKLNRVEYDALKQIARVGGDMSKLEKMFENAPKFKDNPEAVQRAKQLYREHA